MAEIVASKDFPFLWEGKDRKGNRVKGRGLAANETEMRLDLRKQGIAATRVPGMRRGARAPGMAPGARSLGGPARGRRLRLQRWS
jgi:type II secretory pathway component PulF